MEKKTKTRNLPYLGVQASLKIFANLLLYFTSPNMYFTYPDNQRLFFCWTFGMAQEYFIERGPVFVSGEEKVFDLW